MKLSKREISTIRCAIYRAITWTETSIQGNMKPYEENKIREGYEEEVGKEKYFLKRLKTLERKLENDFSKTSKV